MQKARENRSKSLEALLGRLIIQVLLPQVCKFYYKYRRKKKKKKDVPRTKCGREQESQAKCSQ
jgi:hypothetical protein